MASTGADQSDSVMGSVPVGVNPFVCNICHKTYGRIDHLARHFRSHTNEKPFRCAECGKAFTRADLLKRHGLLHVRTELSGKKRKMRASQACAACASIKVKCDQEKPCKRCQTKGLECRIENASGSHAPTSSNGNYSDRMSDSPKQEDLTANASSLGMLAQTFAGSMAAMTPVSVDNTNDSSPQLCRESHRENLFASTENSSLGEFLRDILRSDSRIDYPTTIPNHTSLWDQQENYSSRNMMDFSQEFDTDFGDLNQALVGGEWDQWLLSIPTNTGTDRVLDELSDASSPSIDESINLGAAAYQRSAWQWIPSPGEGIHSQSNLTSVLATDTPNQPLPSSIRHHPTHRLESFHRDSMIGLLFAVSEKVSYQRVMTLFPEPKILQVFLDDFLLTMDCSIDSWIHIPTLCLSEAQPELLTLMVANGAILSPAGHAQRFGYAMQELMRLALPKMFEQDNSKTRELHALQALAICLNVGTWSGNKRTMELAESQAAPLITMLRRSGRFRRPLGSSPVPSAGDTPAELDRKWRTWVEVESFKRLAYHVFLYSVQISIAFRTPPLVSYAEINLELPAPHAMWQARSAAEWRDACTTYRLDGLLPSFISSMRDAQIIGSVRHHIDLELTLYLILLSHWCLAWEYMQLNAVNQSQTSAHVEWAGTFIASSNCEELRKLLDGFHAAIESWNVVVPKEVHMVSQLLRMNLCVSFEDIQILAGKEGVKEARRVLPALKRWWHSPESRRTIWHAGQTLRAARRPAWRSVDRASTVSIPNTAWLRDFNAVVLFHAGLALWAYGLLSRAHLDGRLRVERAVNGTDLTPASNSSHPRIFLDGDEDALSAIDRHQFFGLNQGLAQLSAPRYHGSRHDPSNSGAHSLISPGSGINDGASCLGTDAPDAISLDDPEKVMDVLVDVLSRHSLPYDGGDYGGSRLSSPQHPPMVDSLIQLLQDFGKAASTI